MLIKTAYWQSISAVARCSQLLVASSISDLFGTFSNRVNVPDLFGFRVSNDLGASRVRMLFFLCPHGQLEEASKQHEDQVDQENILKRI